MIAHVTWIAAAVAALVSASPGGDVERPRLDLSVEPGLGLYLSQAFGPKCRDTRGCAAGPSVAAQFGVRVAPTIDAVIGWRHVWSSSPPSRIDEPAAGLAWWPGTSQTSFAARFYATVGPVFTPYQSGFEGQIGGEFIVFPQRWVGLGLASQFELGVLDSAEIDSLHLGAVLHFRF